MYPPTGEDVAVGDPLSVGTGLSVTDRESKRSLYQIKR